MEKESTVHYEIPTGFTRWAIVFAAVLGSSVFDLTWIIVGVALPHMQGTFSTTPDQIAWVMTSFIVGGTMMTACTGWASPRFGRKRLFVLSISANLLTTFMCGVSDSLASEVFWRFMQGVFSAPLLALGQSFTIDAFPPHRRAFATGLWGACTVGIVVMAPLLGGYLIEHLSWRWVFFINIPVAAIAAICTWLYIPKSAPDPNRRFEWIGFTALVAMVGALQLGLSRGERLSWFESNEIRIEFAIAAVALVTVICRTVFVRHSFIEKRLFTDRNYLLSINIMLLYGGLVTLPMILFPMMLQQVNGYPAISAGALMLPRGAGLVIASFVVGLLGRTDPRAILTFGFLCTAGPNLYTATWTSDVSEQAIVITNFVHGLAAGALFIPMVTMALATLDRRLHTEALTFMFLLMNVGKAVGVAGIFVLHSRLMQINHAVLSEQITLTTERLNRITLPDNWNLHSQSGLATIAAEISRQAEIIAYLNAFLAIGVIATLILPFLYLLKKPIDPPRAT